jgi:hypothetical protein
MARRRVEGFYEGLSGGEKVAAAAITSVAVVGAGALAFSPDLRDMALSELNGRVLPVPGLDGLGVELNTEGDNIMVGFHLDVGSLLPGSLGFGPSEATPIGAPPAMRQLATDASSGEAPEPRSQKSVPPRTPGIKVQRQPSPAPAATANTWHPPFGMEPAASREEARDSAVAFAQALHNLQTQLERSGDQGSADEMADIVDEAMSWMQALSGRPADPLTADEVKSLSEFGRDIEKSYGIKLSIMKAKAQAALKPLSNARPPDTSKIEDELAESMHFAFIEGAEDRIGAIKESLGALDDYKAKAADVLTWADRAANLIGNSKLLGHIETAVGGLERADAVLGKVNKYLDAAKVFTTLTGLSDQAISPTKNKINEFEAGIQAIDMSMGFFKCMPQIGIMWSSYYGPMTQACLQLIGILARHKDVEGRQVGLYYFWRQQMEGKRVRGFAPMIPKHLLEYFPGGQLVLNFMFGVMHGRDPAVLPPVEKFFLQHKGLLNVKQEDWDKLESKGGGKGIWQKPDEEKLENLVPWVKRNRQVVWAMLYGNLDPLL